MRILVPTSEGFGRRLKKLIYIAMVLSLTISNFIDRATLKKKYPCFDVSLRYDVGDALVPLNWCLTRFMETPTELGESVFRPIGVSVDDDHECRCCPLGDGATPKRPDDFRVMFFDELFSATACR